MFASSRTIPAPFHLKVAFFGHIVFKQLQVHSFYIVYALSTSYIHWPVVSDHFAPCIDHFPAQIVLFLPCMRAAQTFKKKSFFGHEKQPFELQQNLARINHSSYIDRTTRRFILPLSTNADWLRMNHTSKQPGFKPQTRKECRLNQGKGNRGHGKSVGSIRAQGEKRETWVSRHYLSLTPCVTCWT